MRNCPKCNGDGYVLTKCWTQCGPEPGDIEKDFREEPCDNCDGHGHHPADWTGCDLCVDRQAEIETAWQEYQRRSPLELRR